MWNSKYTCVLLILNTHHISLLSYEIIFFIHMSISFCEVAKKLTLPPKINEPVMELYRCLKWSEGSRVAPLNSQNVERNSEIYTAI